MAARNMAWMAPGRTLSIAKIDGILGITDDTPFEQFMARREALRTVLSVLAGTPAGPISADDDNDAIRERVRRLRDREQERGHGYGVACCNMVLHGTTNPDQTAADAAAEGPDLTPLTDALTDLKRSITAAPENCGRCGSTPAPYRLQGVALCQSCDETLNAVAVGDRVRDPFDGTWREIVHIDGIADGGTCHMRDGGCMSVAECVQAEKRLPGEGVS